MKELLYYEGCSTLYLFNQERLMTKPQKKLTKDDERAPAKDGVLQTACIAEVMANTRNIKTKDIHNFGHFCEPFLEYIFAIGQGPERLNLVFNSYVEGSIKDSEGNRHQDKAPIEMDRFCSSSNKKLKLQMLLQTQSIQRGI